jgi:hypothetical protein
MPVARRQVCCGCRENIQLVAPGLEHNGFALAATRAVDQRRTGTAFQLQAQQVRVLARDAETESHGLLDRKAQ